MPNLSGIRRNATRRRSGVALTTLTLVLAPLTLLAAPFSPTASASAATKRPNVLFILTDDMRLDDLQYMPYTRRLFRQHGTEFTHALSPHPLCCPARAELLTGQYAHNNGVRANSGTHGGWQALGGKDNLLFDWFRRAGYRTAFIGKLMNGYKGGRVSGLTDNDATVRRTYNATRVVTYNNGRPTTRGGHQLTYMARRVRNLIADTRSRPFFIWAGVVAPHMMMERGRWVPPVPPAGYKRLRTSHRRPPSLAKRSFSGGRATHRKVRKLHRGRVLSLYATDDLVRKAVAALKARRQWSRTILVFASDNGMGMGSHSIIGKNQPYQDVVRVPLLIAGPGVPTGRVDTVTTLVDLPQTLTRLAGVSMGRDSDGEDLFARRADRAVLIQAGGKAEGWPWRGVYTRRYTYVERESGKVELYDRDTDPLELDNLGRNDEMARLLESLRHCRGAGCAATA